MSTTADEQERARLFDLIDRAYTGGLIRWEQIQVYATTGVLRSDETDRVPTTMVELQVHAPRSVLAHVVKKLDLEARLEGQS